MQERNVSKTKITSLIIVYTQEFHLLSDAQCRRSLSLDTKVSYHSGIVS